MTILARRHFLKIGALGLGGLALPRLEAKDGKRRSLINIHLNGGPSHQDLWDLKPEAPSEVRGEFRPIGTNVPGIEICEHFPNLAKMADTFALVRGVVGSVNEHGHGSSITGYSKESLRSVGGRPSIGSVVSRLAPGASDRALPYVSLMTGVQAGFLGPIHQPFMPDSGGRANLRLGSIDAGRLQGRTELLSGLDTMRRDADMEAMDAFTRRAVEVVASGKMSEALEVEREGKATLRRYVGDGRGRSGDNRQFLMARRLVEVGVRCVQIQWGIWDTHENNFGMLREQLPLLDLGVSALLTDLVDRGMLDDVGVVLWGDFGRTPKINAKAGRDHWPQVSAAFLAGGGIRGGQVVGASDRLAGEALTPVHLHQIYATIYRNLGIDFETPLTDPSGRPQYLLDHRQPIKELL